jgi:predicted transposase/invertase (TIGR01784 family)
MHSFALRDDMWPDENRRLKWLQLRFLEFRKTRFPDDNSRRWARFLDTGTVPHDSPDYLAEAEDLVKFWNLSTEERTVMTLLERAREREAMEWLGAWDQGHEDGHAEGLTEGHTKGLAEGLAHAATGMLARGMSAQDVAEITGMPLVEIEQLGRK